jgi:diguanylate cyclase (GGDEF)-like protein/PAS domain S-box-containing protein
MAVVTFSDDPASLVNLYRETLADGDQDIAQARSELAYLGDTRAIARLDAFAEQRQRLEQEAEGYVTLALDADSDALAQMAQQYLPLLWPASEALIADMEELAKEQQTALTAERTAADTAADRNLFVLVALSMCALLAGVTSLILLGVSAVRPLASLQASVEAMASGDLETRAAVSGPQETASLGRRFNEMIDARQRAEQKLLESDQRYHALFDRSLDAVYVHDFEGRYLDANDAALRLLGYERSDIPALSFADLLDDSQLPAALAAAEEILSTGKQAKPTTFKLRRKDGSFVEVETLAAALYEEGRPVAIQGIARDITERRRAENALRKAHEKLEERVRERTADLALANLQLAQEVADRKRAEAELRQSEEKYRQIFENVQDVYFQTDAQGRIIEVSPSVERYGYTREQLVGTPVLDIYEDPQDRAAHVAALLERGEVVDYDLRLKTADGGVYLASASSRVRHDSDGVVIGFEGFLRDITERKKAEEALRERARRDPLTSVLNHGGIVEELRSVTRGGRGQTSHVIAMVDVDGLKAINDTYGHQVGDAVLSAVASSLCSEGALVGRYGGDEFVAILADADRAAGERYRDAVLAALAERGLKDPETGARVPTVATIGLAVYPEEAESVADLIGLSDSALYAQKRQRPIAAPTGPDQKGGERAARAVGEMIPLLTSPGDLDDKLRLVAHRLSSGVGYGAVHFSLFLPDGRAGVPMAANAFAKIPGELLDEWNAGERTQRPGPHPMRLLLERTRRPVILDDPHQGQSLLESERNILKAAGLRSVMVAPLIWQGEVIGLVGVADKEEAAFGPHDAQFLTAIAAQVTAIVRMATLIDDLQSTSVRLTEAQTETVMMLAAAAEAHDHTTGPHLQNVRALTHALARELGHSEDDAWELGLAAVLHDIGKIRVPDLILSTAGRLADEEWELMKQHTVWGAEFLAARPRFERAAVIARSHHEHWDGSGYPDGLSGDNIPTAAAVVAVADAFDAMTSDRPYRAARTIDAAVREIAACSGHQFDPAVARALVRLHEREGLTPLVNQSSREPAAA